jgi:hypothetical protein
MDMCDWLDLSLFIMLYSTFITKDYHDLEKEEVKMICSEACNKFYEKWVGDQSFHFVVLNFNTNLVVLKSRWCAIGVGVFIVSFGVFEVS